MSWDSNCATLASTYPALDAICISDQTGLLYGTSKRDTFVPTQGELSEMVRAIKSGGGPTAIMIGGQRYMVLRIIDNRMIAKQNKKTLFGALTTKLLLVGISEDTDQERKSEKGNDQMFKLQEYYIGTGN